MIIRSSHSFGEGRANTSIDCVWVAELAKEKNEENEAPTALDADERFTKCTIDSTSNFGFRGTPPEENEDTVGEAPP